MPINISNFILSGSSIQETGIGGIVTDGLVLHLDAGYKHSYPMGGTTWYDLKGSNNGTLTNGPTFSTNNGGSIRLDGVNDYIRIPFNSSFNVTSNPFTVIIWNKKNTTSDGFNGLITADSTSDNVWKIFKDNGELFYKTRSGGTILSFSNYVVGKWHMYAFTKSGSTLINYFNGVQVNSNSSSGNPTSFSNDLAIGSYRLNDAVNGLYLMDQDFSIFMLYNRALSADEILQNFNVTRSRFGIGITGGVSGAGIAAEGGTESTITVGSDQYRVHEFTSSGTLSINTGYTEIRDVEYLVIAGGGSSGDGFGGGGGAGGYRSSVNGENSGGGASAESKLTITANATVTIGGGGAASAGGFGTVGSNGSNSVFSTITSTGGGRGGAYNIQNGASGGSGGGGSVVGGSGTGGAGTANQGYAGGNGSLIVGNSASGGGGGASQAGSNGTSTAAGNGGNGVSSSITGTATYRAGGGAGMRQGTTEGNGGLGGGGDHGQDGAANTGGGGGSEDKSGGSGVVIIRYKI